MAHNPLLGNRISLISKKDIRYEGTLYSINEADATVALANVKSYGTEGREVSSGGTFIPPMADIFSYLVFRGCDIKDLHVHDNATTTATQQQQEPEPSKASSITEGAKPIQKTTATKEQSESNRESTTEESPSRATVPSKNKSLITSNATTTTTTTTATKVTHATARSDSNAADAKVVASSKAAGTSSRTSTTTASKVTPTTAAVGTGESLLNRKLRGGTTTAAAATATTTATSNLDSKSQSLQDVQEFDFQSSANKFEKETAEEEPNPKLHYTKDNFFDSISCDALDKQAGRTSDPRLRGAVERQLNTETFGAASLAGYNNQRRGTNNKNSSSWRRGGGGGRGRGRGRGNRTSNDYNNKPRHYNSSNNNNNKNSTPKPISSRVSPE